VGDVYGEDVTNSSLRELGSSGFPRPASGFLRKIVGFGQNCGLRVRGGRTVVTRLLPGYRDNLESSSLDRNDICLECPETLAVTRHSRVDRRTMFRYAPVNR